MATSDSVEPSTGSLEVTIGHDDAIDETIAAEIISMALFDAGAQAVGEGSDGRSLVAGFPSVDDAEAAGAALAQAHPLLVASVEASKVLTADWVNAQQAGLQPTAVGRWHIRAPWHEEPLDIDPKFDIVIDPGPAFGHGGHPSTMLAIELLTRRLDKNPNRRVFDIGTGTGVLAIVAARMGATVVATDIDNDVLTTAYRNVDRNSGHPFDELADRIALYPADEVDIAPTDSDLVVVNVTLDVQRQLAPTLQHVSQLICSGLLTRQVRAMGDTYPDRFPPTILVSGDWAAVDYS